MKLQVDSNFKQPKMKSNESGMKLQVVSNFKLANNEAASCFRAQMSQDNYKFILILNNLNDATSCFQL